MKHLPLIILLCFIACGKKNKPKKDSFQGIPYVLISDDVNDYIGSLTGGSTETQTTGASAGGGTGSNNNQPLDEEITSVTTGGTSGSETTGGTSGSETTGGTSGSETTGGTSGSETTGGTSGSETTGGTSGSETTGGTSGSETTGGTSGAETTGGTSGSETTGSTNPVSLVDAKVVSCNFSNVNEQQSLSMNITEQNGNKYAELSSDANGKVEFDGYIFRPSSNSNAAVHSGEKNLKINGKDVLKITARILFNPETGTGELQLSYKLKGKKGVEEQTEFSALAEINHCSVIE